MGGFATGVVVVSASFMLGTLSMHWTADHLMLWQAPVTKESLLTAHTYYYRTFSEGSRSVQLLITSIGTAGAAAATIKIAGGRESNWLFDGASLFLYCAIAVVFSQKVFPSISSLPPLDPPPAANPMRAADPLGVALRDVATANAVIAAALIGVILLQSGQYYSERLEEQERAEELDARIRRRQRKQDSETRDT